MKTALSDIRHLMKVLIVDDDMATVAVIRDTVPWERLGVGPVFTAGNVRAAKAVLTAEAVDIIISDIEMPQGSGIELLRWFREAGLAGEFLLLTCHESFDYATHAVKLQAAEYLLKPFDAVVLEAALKKIILKIREQRQLQANSELGKWVQKSRRQLQIAFWQMALSEKVGKSMTELRREITGNNLEIDPEREYCLVVSRVTDVRGDKEKYGPGLLLFIMENIHSEKLCGNPENNAVTVHNYHDDYILATVCQAEREPTLTEGCLELIGEFNGLFSAVITCCIGRSCRIGELGECFRRMIGLLERNIIYYGGCFREEQAIAAPILPEVLLDEKRLEELLAQKQKIALLNYLKEQINDRYYQRVLNEPLLRQAKQEVLQAVYVFLVKRGLSAAELFNEGRLEELGRKASQSVTDFMRWLNLLLERVFGYEAEVARSLTLSEKVNQDVREHYQENIGRNEIAARLFLAPEYMARMYKRQTGKSLNEFIGEYRIEQAKLRLEKGERIGDVAEAVGFESFTYFSTMFKKYVGVSPNQYRKKE